VIVIVISEF